MLSLEKSVNQLNSKTNKAKAKKYTYADYLQLDDENHYEIINGEVIMAPSPRRMHQKILKRLALLLDNAVEKIDSGELYFAPFDVIFADTQVFQPDILFVSKERLEIIKEDGVFGSPDLIIEIVSPSTEQKDRNDKYRVYEHFGVKEYWIVDEKNRTVEVFVLKENGYKREYYAENDGTVESVLIKGFKIDVKVLFE